MRDIRMAIRSLWRTPVFTIVTTGSLALGLALTASTVSVVNAYLERSLPYPDAARLYHVMYAPPGPWEPRGMTELDWTIVSDVVEHPIAASSDSISLADGGYASSLRALRATRGFLDGLGVRAVVGRTLTPADFAGSERVALIGHALWRDRFRSDPGVIGRLIRGEADTRPGSPETYRIVGVLTPGFYFGRDSTATVDLLTTQTSRVRAYMVKLHAGVTRAAAERRITEAVRLAATSPIPGDWPGAQLESVHERYAGSLRPVFIGLTVAVALVLLIVSANVAVLMLLRAMQRQKDIAVHLALGASRRDLARMLLAETSLIVMAALVLGVGVTTVVLANLSPLIQAQLGRPAPRAAGIALDGLMLAIVGGIGVSIALSISLAPLMTWGRRLLHALQQRGRGASDRPAMRRIRHGLIVFEIAGSLVLLVGCGLMIRSVGQMLTTDLGFQPQGMQRSRSMLKNGKYPNAAAYSRFHETFAARLAASSGSPVVFSSWPPFAEAPSRRIETETTAASAGTIAVSPGYFSLFQIAIRQGREFADADASGSDPVAVISNTLARQLFQNGPALGQQVRVIEETPAGLAAGPWRTVIGLAADVRQAYDDSNRADFYTPKIPDGRYATFYLRARRPQALLLADFRSVAAEIDPEAVINEPRLVADDDQRLAGTKFITGLLTGFALTAAFLSMIGIYGVTAYGVQQRRLEVAIRIALGAAEPTIVRMFMRQGGLLLGIGTLAGLAGSVVLSRALRHHVFGVQSFDVVTCLCASALLAGAGLAAVWWPARRVAKLHPASALNGQ